VGRSTLTTVLQQHNGEHVRPRILVFAYACEPGRGSEPGAGWGLVRALAEFADCTVLVGPEHMPSIQRWQGVAASDGLEFVVVEEPAWAPPEPRHRLTRFVVYLAWLRRARAAGLRLHRRRPFKAVHHATYSVYWLPTAATAFDVPCIWGPVGGAVVTPTPLWRLLGWRGVCTEMLDLVAVRAFGALPSARRASRSAVVLVQNEETRDRLPGDVQRRAVVLNHAMFTELPEGQPVVRGSECVFVGALESRKGARLVINALSYAEESVCLCVIGDGPERATLEQLSRRLGLSERVRFVGRRTREEVLAHVRGAAAVVFTGLREEGGIALAEAMLAGAPVIVLAHGGARTIAATSCDRSRVVMIAPADAETTARRIGAAMSQFRRQVPARTDPTLDVASARNTLREALERVCLS
jgi:glycosyltransferase involved in cell wall biosynthesis